MIKVHFYDGTLTRIVRTGSYKTVALAKAAMRRAHRKGRVAAFAGRRMAQDPPTCHH